jgi:hypothetical protein
VGISRRLCRRDRFRRAEIKIVKENPAPEHEENKEPEQGQMTSHPPAEQLIGKKIEEEELEIRQQPPEWSLLKLFLSATPPKDCSK